MKSKTRLNHIFTLFLIVILITALSASCSTTSNPSNQENSNSPNNQTKDSPQPPVEHTEEVNQPPTEPPSTQTPATESPALGIGSTMISYKNDMVMVYVPAGEFEMGNDIGEHGDEMPMRTIYLDSFWIYKTEVTNAMFAEFLNASGNWKESGAKWLNAGDDGVRIHYSEEAWIPYEGLEDHPVAEVTWYGAQAYCKWAKDRLPTEAEWEKASGGTDGRTYPWGEEISCDLAQYADCGGQTVPVSSFPDGASPYGALDMSGNVQEWVADWYSGNGDYDPNSLMNPTGLPSGSDRAMRGGYWGAESDDLRVDNRSALYPSGASYTIGFRCASSPKEFAVIPDVIGLTREEAYQILEGLGFNPLTLWILSDNYGHGTVTEINYPVGEEVRVDAEVILNVVGVIVKEKPSGDDKDDKNVCIPGFTLSESGTECIHNYDCAILPPPGGQNEAQYYCVHVAFGGSPLNGWGFSLPPPCHCLYNYTGP